MIYVLIRYALLTQLGLLVWLNLLPRAVRADVRLPAILSDHMVLQQKSTVTLWGWCEPAEKITVRVGWDTTVYRTTGKNTATWQLKLETPAVQGAYQITISGRNTVVLNDVLLGEVWLCGGQSNMEWGARHGIQQAIEAAPKASNDRIRFFYVPKTTAETPQEDTRARWVVCTPETMKQFSAIGYFFGEKLQYTLHSAVGLINANWGGTPAEVWTPASLIQEDSVLRSAAGRQKDNMDYWPVQPGLAYNAMIHPLRQYAMAGVLWYQGESNVSSPGAYERLFTTLIKAWRGAWQTNLPVYYVQIAPYSGYESPLAGTLLREAQAHCSRIPKTGMVVIDDLVDNVSDIHPQNKKDVAIRLARYALSDTYGQPNLAFRSPVYASHVVENDQIRLFFDQAEEGLVLAADRACGFTIAGADQVFYSARVRLEGNTIRVSSPQVRQPVAVRYGFSDTTRSAVFSRQGLPLAMFRTDAWPVP